MEKCGRERQYIVNAKHNLPKIKTADMKDTVHCNNVLNSIQSDTTMLNELNATINSLVF